MVPRRPLSKREYEVLSLRARGMTNKAVAGRFGTTERTVKNQMGIALRKLGASCLIEAMNDMGWVRIEDYELVVGREIELEKAAYRARVQWLKSHLRD